MASRKSKQPIGAKSARPDRSGRRRASPGLKATKPTAQSATAPAQATSGFTLPWLSAMGMAEPAQAPIPAEGLVGMQQEYMQRLGSLWSDLFTHSDKTAEPIADARFADPAWQGNPLASFYARAYLLNSEFMRRMADSVKIDPRSQRRLKFAVSQFVDAASPANFLATNPAAQQRLLESGGASLRAGMENLLGDIAKGKISQTDESAFEVGTNVATSRGIVVFENRLFQLIQYEPTTAKVYARPYLMIPPCINKFYILDLQPENSFVRYSVEQGHTVFLMSWKNPHEPEAKLTWDDYLEEGAIKAIHVTQEISGSRQINALGFCVGGTLICNALAVMYARGEQSVTSLTLLTALLDFEDTGVLDVFIDEAHVKMKEAQLGKGGLMPGRDLANTFSSLRANDLVWNYVVSNYLEGKAPPAFDLLYWNGDSTNLPGPMYAWYLRNMYLENSLRVPDKLTCCGQPVDLNRIRVPTYVFAAREDHIVPWKAAYASARLLPGDKKNGVRFVLGASGHIAGTINPPTKNKRSHWIGTHELPANSEAWLHAATEHPGSWWPDLSRWLAPYGGAQVAAPRKYGSAKYKPIEPAPGRYVREKA